MARLGALRERNFRRLFAGQAVSSFGDALVPVALAFAVLRRTGSATDLGLVLAAEMFSQQVSYLLGGVLADRWSRRVVMVAADAGRAAGELILGGLLVAGHPALWVFCALAALQGAGGGLFGPAASGLVPAVVSDQHVQQANQLQSMARGVASVAGPAAGGLLLLTVGAGWALLADGVSFAVSLVTLLGLGLHLPPRERISSPLQDLRSGWAAFSSRRWYVVTVAFIAAFNLFGGAWLTLGPVIVRRSLGGAGGWAAISSVGALGAVVGGFGMLRVRPRHPFRFGARLAAFWPLTFLAVGLRLPLAAVCALSALGTFGIVTYDDLHHTAVQQVIPDAVLSRVLSYDYLLGDTTRPVGAILAGPLAAALGAGTVLAGASILVLVVIVAMGLTPVVRNFTVEEGRRREAERAGAGAQRTNGT